MSISPNVAEVAALLGETSRAIILTSLMDGRFHTASELAYMKRDQTTNSKFSPFQIS